MENQKYHRSGHGKYLLRAHLVLACKYRKKLLYGRVDDDMKAILQEIAAVSDFSIEVMESDKDHVQLLVNYLPDLTVVSIVRRLKSMSTIRIWERQCSFLVNHFWREKTFWSDGYFACSVGDASADTIRRCIEEQG